MAISAAHRAGIDAVRQELQRAGAVMAERGQQVVGVRTFRADPFRHAFTDYVTVRQKIVEDTP